MNLGLAGEYKYTIKKVKDNSIVRESDWHSNLILDNAFTTLSNSDLIQAYLQPTLKVGTGSATPDKTQVTLTAAVPAHKVLEYRYHSEHHDVWEDSSLNIVKAMRSYIYIYRFREAVNLTELGLANSTGDVYKLYTRTLFKDSSGPTTLTILTDEYLEISYRLWGVWSTEEKSTSITLQSKSRDSVVSNETIEIKSNVVSARAGEHGRDKNNPLLSVRGRIHRGALCLTQRIDLTKHLEGKTVDGQNLDRSSIAVDGYVDLSTHVSADYSNDVLTLKIAYIWDRILRDLDTNKIRAICTFSGLGSYGFNLPEGKEITLLSTQSFKFVVEYKIQRYTGSIDTIKAGTPYAS